MQTAAQFVLTMYRVIFFTGTPLKVLSVRLHSKSHQKSSKCQNLLTGWHLEFLGGTSEKKNHPVDFQSSHHLLPELLRGAGETAFLVQGDKHMGWEGLLQISIGSERQHLDDNRTFHNQKHRRFRYRVNFCQTSSVFSDSLDLLDHSLLLDILALLPCFPAACWF